MRGDAQDHIRSLCLAAVSDRRQVERKQNIGDRYIPDFCYNVSIFGDGIFPPGNKSLLAKYEAAFVKS